MISSGRLAVAAIVSSLLFAAPPAAAGSEARELIRRATADPALRNALVHDGRTAAAFCANCHGDNGNSRYSEVPNLAGQHPEYVHNQIEAFLAGKRKNEFMEGLMKVLSERDKAAIALTYANSTVTPANPKPGPRAAEGGVHYQKLCARCHQADARGAEAYPRLAGQQVEYLRLSLNRYLAMSGERNYAPMSAAVMQLGKDNIEAVVQYLSSLN